MRSLLRGPAKALLLGGLLLGVGTLHFVSPKPFDSIIPRALPEEARRPLTYASGVVEVAAGAMLLAPRTRRLGGRLAFWLILAVWPANIDAALRGGYPGLPGVVGGATAAWIRVPLQLPLLWLAHRIARDPGTPTGPATETNARTDA